MGNEKLTFSNRQYLKSPQFRKDDLWTALLEFFYRLLWHYLLVSPSTRHCHAHFSMSSGKTSLNYLLPYLFRASCYALQMFLDIGCCITITLHWFAEEVSSGKLGDLPGVQPGTHLFAWQTSRPPCRVRRAGRARWRFCGAWNLRSLKDSLSGKEHKTVNTKLDQKGV